MVSHLDAQFRQISVSDSPSQSSSLSDDHNSLAESSINPVISSSPDSVLLPGPSVGLGPQHPAASPDDGNSASIHLFEATGFSENPDLPTGVIRDILREYSIYFKPF